VPEATTARAPRVDTTDADVRRLRIVADALGEAGVHWWVDHGTLLGLVRDGGFLPWDDDLDVSFNRAEHARVVRALLEHKPALRARMIVTGRGVKLVPHAANERTHDISSYAREGADVVKHFVRFRRGHEGRSRPWREWLHGPFDALDRALQALDAWLWDGDRRWPTPIGRALVALVGWPAVMRERAGTHEVSRVPAELLERHEHRAWFDMGVPIPADVERYLRYRYGADWQVPRRTWTWWDDDRTVGTRRPGS